MPHRHVHSYFHHHHSDRDARFCMVLPHMALWINIQVADLQVAKPHIEKCYMTLSKFRASSLSPDYGGLSWDSKALHRKMLRDPFKLRASSLSSNYGGLSWGSKTHFEEWDMTPSKLRASSISSNYGGLSWGSEPPHRKMRHDPFLN